MVTLTIDGQRVDVAEGLTILDAARELHVPIPTLCHNDALVPYGACRLCMVEIAKDGRSKLVASCLYPVEEGLEVDTRSERVMSSRQLVLEFLLARCPGVKMVQDLAREMGVDHTPFETGDDECILCGMCVRACEEVVGVSALGFIGRGVDREVGPPFLEAPEVCVGCGSCAEICPTGAIKIEDIGDRRRIHNWNAEFELAKCKICKKSFATKAQLEFLKQQSGLSEAFFEVCPDCMREG